MSDNLNPIDSFELDVLDHTGDIELAQQVGHCARTAVIAAAEALAQVLGVEVDTGALAASMLDLEGEQ